MEPSARVTEGEFFTSGTTSSAVNRTGVAWPVLVGVMSAVGVILLDLVGAIALLGMSISYSLSYPCESGAAWDVAIGAIFVVVMVCGFHLLHAALLRSHSPTLCKAIRIWTFVPAFFGLWLCAAFVWQAVTFQPVDC